MLKPFALRCSLALVLLSPALAGAAELYRYVDDKGVTVLDRQGVPPEYIGKGYEVLNEHGRVVRVVPPAPSREEMQRQLDEKARASTDAKLLRLYTSVEDVDRALERKLTELDGLIGVARGNQQSLRTQQASLQSQAAESERAGREVPAHLVQQIDSLRDQQKSLDKDIARYEQDREAAKTAYAADRARLTELLGGAR
jgi:cell division protein FtsB